jgi:hypothetical protein
MSKFQRRVKGYDWVARYVVEKKVCPSWPRSSCQFFPGLQQPSAVVDLGPERSSECENWPLVSCDTPRRGVSRLTGGRAIGPYVVKIRVDWAKAVFGIADFLNNLQTGDHGQEDNCERDENPSSKHKGCPGLLDHVGLYPAGIRGFFRHSLDKQRLVR